MTLGIESRKLSEMDQQVGTGKIQLAGFSDEWKEVTLGDPSIATLTSGGTPSTAVSAFWDGSNYWVTPTDITATKGKYLTSTARRITNEGLSNSSAQMLPVGSLLLCSRATVGDVRISKIPVCTNQGFKAIVAAPGTYNEFLYYKLLTMRETMLERSFGSTFLELPMREAKLISFFIPPYEEQIAIAEVLSDTDLLLESLDKLITKKRAIKQAAIQQLLTGKIRLSGFSGEWQTSTLGELFEIESGKSKSSYLSDSGKYIVVDMGGISQDGVLSANKRTNWDADILSAGALVMPKDDIGGGKIIGKVAHIPVSGKFVLGDHVYRLTSKGCDSKFLSYVINSETVNRELQSKVVGSAQLGLGRKSVTSQSIKHPEFSEQQAIAQVLSDMDIEIETLVKEKEKTALIKVGMMQDLLTGKVRL